jgi:hypothetical protein
MADSIPPVNPRNPSAVFSPVVHSTPEHEELKQIAEGCVTRHHSHHYFGFAQLNGTFSRRRVLRASNHSATTSFLQE